MKVWQVWGINLPKIEIIADCFDNAIKEARKVNSNYSVAQIIKKEV